MLEIYRMKKPELCRLLSILHQHINKLVWAKTMVLIIPAQPIQPDSDMKKILRRWKVGIMELHLPVGWPPQQLYSKP